MHEIPLLTLNTLNNYLHNPQQKKDYISLNLDHDVEKCFAIKIITNTMSPFFEKGSVFVINTAISPQDGDIVLVQFEEHHPCFRKVFIEGTSYFFKNITESLVDIQLNRTQYTLHGVVIIAIQNFHNS